LASAGVIPAVALRLDSPKSRIPENYESGVNRRATQNKAPDQLEKVYKPDSTIGPRQGPVGDATPSGVKTANFLLQALWHGKARDFGVAVLAATLVIPLAHAGFLLARHYFRQAAPPPSALLHPQPPAAGRDVMPDGQMVLDNYPVPPADVVMPDVDARILLDQDEHGNAHGLSRRQLVEQRPGRREEGKEQGEVEEPDNVLRFSDHPRDANSDNGPNRIYVPQTAVFTIPRLHAMGILRDQRAMLTAPEYHRASSFLATFISLDSFTVELPMDTVYTLVTFWRTHIADEQGENISLLYVKARECTKLLALTAQAVDHVICYAPIVAALACSEPVGMGSDAESKRLTHGGYNSSRRARFSIYHTLESLSRWQVEVPIVAFMWLATLTGAFVYLRYRRASWVFGIELQRDYRIPTFANTRALILENSKATSLAVRALIEFS